MVRKKLFWDSNNTVGGKSDWTGMSSSVLGVPLRAKGLLTLGTSGEDIVKRNNDRIKHSK